MPDKKEALMVQAVFAMSQGCADTKITEDACDWFVEHYHPWVDATKEIGKSPQEVWDKEGTGFLGKFKEIGRLAARDGVIDRESLAKAAELVERESDCPYCPIKP
jgi:hypothetical protein